MKITTDNTQLVKEAYDQLQEALNTISTNKGWLDYLSFQSRFYKFSLNNTLLIYSQNPRASYVAGYRQWQGLNRYVMKGEIGIRILAPLKYKVKEDECGDNEFRLAGFKLVSVFDISQTDGSDEFLPTLVGGLKGSFEGEEAIYSRLLDIVEIPVTEVTQLAAKGYYYPSNPRIEIRASMPMVQKIKTLSHELSHHLHHTKYFSGETYDICEVTAESSAFIVCSYLGIDSTDYSAGYVNTWIKDVAAIKATASKVQMISSEIIALLDGSATNNSLSAAS